MARVSANAARYVIGALVVVLGQTHCGGANTVSTDLIDHFVDARKQPNDDAFVVAPVSLDGQAKPSIVSRGSTRLTFHVTVPIHGRFRVFVGLPQETGARAQDGLVFLVGVSDGHVYRDRESRQLQGGDKAGGRRWQEISVALTEYEGMTIDLILNVRVPRNEPHAAAWAQPAILGQ